MPESPAQALTRLRKAGELTDAWNLAEAAIRENPDDIYLKQAVFWVCYAFLKNIQDGIKRRAKDNDNFNPTPFELNKINKYLNAIRWLNIPSGGNICAYRLLFIMFQKNLKAIPELAMLLLTHEPVFDVGKDENNDNEPYVTDNGESPSLMLKFARAIAAAWLDSEVVHDFGADHIIELIKKTKLSVKDEKNIIWLDYDAAKLLITSAQFNLAREFVIPVLKKKNTESWAWAALAATYRKESPDIAIKLFCEGICHTHDAKFSLKSYKSLASLLVTKGLVNEASMCVKKIVAIYNQEGWRIKSDLEDLMASDWYDDSVDVSFLGAFAKTQAEGAKVYLYGETNWEIGVVKSLHASGKGLDVYLNKDCTKSVRKTLFSERKLPVPGKFVKIAISEDGEVVSATQSNPVEMKDVGFGIGTLKVNAKGFGFVDDAFVPPNLIKAELNGRSVQFVKIQEFDKTKGSFGWKVITLMLHEHNE